jgi:hypothetical protein
MATVPAFDDRGMSIGRVFERAFSTIKHNPLVVLGLALLLGAVPALLMTYLLASLGLGASTGGLGSTAVTGLVGAMFASMIVGLVISAIVQGALTRATVAESEGQTATFGECLSVGLRFFLPLIGVGIVFAFGVFFGMLLLIVPGVILLLMWAVAAPAVVVERDGVFKALSRSRELTRGARWKIFGLFLLLGVLYWLLSIVFGLVGLQAYGEPGAASNLAVGNLVGSVVLGTIFNAFWGTIQPSLYVELRHWKEGDSVEELARVFA